MKHTSINNHNDEKKKRIADSSAQVMAIQCTKKQAGVRAYPVCSDIN